MVPSSPFNPHRSSFPHFSLNWLSISRRRPWSAPDTIQFEPINTQQTIAAEVLLPREGPSGKRPRRSLAQPWYTPSDCALRYTSSQDARLSKALVASGQCVSIIVIISGKKVSVLRFFSFASVFRTSRRAPTISHWDFFCFAQQSKFVVDD